MLRVKTITYYFSRIVCSVILLLFFNQASAQEICNNGIDDNGNGLIDLNDTLACNCAIQPPSLIPNASFELKNCCPSTFSEMNCAKDWIQASSATADYMNTCGFIFSAATAAGLAPFPDGNAIAGFISSIGYQEYVGACLTTPLLADTTYALQMRIASTPITGQGGVCNGGTINYSPSNIVIYGSTNCSNLPYSGQACPPAPQWQILDSVLYTPVNTWGIINFNFTPSVNIDAIIIGSPCTLPSDYNGSSTTCYPYFYIDQLELNKPEFVSTITQTGSWCANSTVLTGTTVAGATYQWYHEGVAIVGQTNSVLNVSANNLPTGNYSLATTLNGNCKYVSIKVVEFSNPPNIGPISTYCQYDPPFNLTANLAGGTWSGTGITNANTGTFNPAMGTVGNNMVIYTMANAGTCARADTSYVVIDPSPVAYAGADTTICSGTSLTLGGPSTSGYFYSWAPTSGLSNAYIAAPTFTLTNNTGAAITANYSLIVMDPSTGCQALDQLVIVVNPAPKINPTGPFCRNDPGGILTASTTGGTWSGTGIINSNFGTFSPAAANVGNNLITYTLTGACGGGDTAIIVVTEPVASNAGTDVAVCAGDSVLIGANATAGYTYSWSPTTALSSTTISNPYVLTTNSGSTVQTVSYILNTSYNGCTGKDTVVVTINPQPNLEVMNPPTTCTSTPADITAPSITSGTSGGGVLSYWLDSMATMPLTNASAITIAGTYYVKATATGGCFDIQPVVVSFNPSPTANAGSDVLMCTGDTVTIGSANVQGNTYAWLPTTGLSNSSISNPTITLTNTGSSLQTFVYVVTATALGCSDVDTISITVNPLPVANAGMDMEVCAGINGTLNGTVVGVSGGGWSGGSGTYSPSANALNAEYAPTLGELAQGSVTLILTTDVPAGGCDAVKDTVVLTFAAPAIANAGSDDTICAGGSVVLNGSILGTATSGMWSGGDGVFAPNNTQLNATYTPSVAEVEIGHFTLVLTTDNPPNACNTTTDTVMFAIQTSPIANAGANQFVCAGSEINLVGSISGSATSAVWSGGQGVFYPSANALTTTYIPSESEQNLDSLIVKLTTNNPVGFPCNVDTDSLIIYFYPKPTANFSVNDVDGCPEHCVDFNDLTSLNGGSAVNSWVWTFGDNSANATIQNPSHCYTQSGLYDVTLVVSSQDNCKDTLVMPEFIEVFNTPTASFDYTPNPATVTTTTITLHDEVSNDVTTWLWSFGDGDSLALDSSGAVHVYPSNEPQTYQTTLVVQNAMGCSDTIINNVVINPEFSFFIPNAFTPNGDGINDFFCAKGVGIESYELIVFNRWGNVVFTTNDFNKMWDGSLSDNDETITQEVYVWKVNISDMFQKKYNYIGTVTVVK